MLSRLRIVGNHLKHFERIPCFFYHEKHASLLISYRCVSDDQVDKVQKTLKMLKEDLKRQYEEEKRTKLPTASKKEKLPLITRIKNEAIHYYHGFRLFFLELRISNRYLWRLFRGETLTRRERQQLVRSVTDLFRVIPFVVFIIVPFMDFLIPFYIKFFPGALPSTFEGASEKDEKVRRTLKAKVEMARFLQESIEELPKLKKMREAENKESKAAEFAEFVKKVRTEGSYVKTLDILKFAKLFEDELTLDNLAMSQLRALCRVLGIRPLGTPEILRFQLQMKLRELKADDLLIAEEGGVDMLAVSDLMDACRARGMRAFGVSEERLRMQLKQWIELSIDDKIPPSLLLLSRVFYLPEDINFADRIKATLAQLPEDMSEQTRQKLSQIEGGTINFEERLELLKSIEKDLIEERKLTARIAEEQKQQKEKEKVNAEVNKTEKEEKEDKNLEEDIETVEWKAQVIRERFEAEKAKDSEFKQKNI